MRKQRNAAFTDEIITNQKGVSAEKNDIESSDTSGLKSREKNSFSLEYGTENLDSCHGIGACGDGSIDVTERYIRLVKVPYYRAFRALCRQRQEPDQASKIALSEHINRSGRRVE